MSNGFEYTIEIRDRFSKLTEEFKAALAEAKAEAGGLSKELKALERASNEAKKALSGTSEAVKEAVKAEEDLSKAIGTATAAQRKRMTIEQRADDTLAKRIEKQREIALVEAKAAEQGISLSRKKTAALKEEATVEDRINKIIERRAALREVNAGLRGLGFDPRGDKTGDRVDEILARRKETRDTNEALRSRGFDTKGDTTEQRVNEIIQRRKELLEQVALLKQRGFDKSGNALKAEATLEERVTAVIERQARARELVDALRARGFDKSGNALRGELTVQEEVNRIIARQNRLREINLALQAQGRTSTGKIPLTPQEAAQSKAANELRRLEIKKLYKEIEAANPRIRELRRELGETESVGNRISFTFRRLFGILALFTIFRQVISGLREMIAESVRFNAIIETSALGIASLISATGKVSNATGEVTSTTESWTLAQKEARKQLQLLRKDALTTAATFPELATAFQTAIGPGLQAGLKLDEIRQFSSAISKAASALGLEQNQLPEEIRSLLAGTISKRNTRIATSLGITNDDVKRARELGVLFEFLEQKFGAFNRASEDGAKTFTVLLSNAKDALGNLLGVSFIGFFERLKELLTIINTSIVRLQDGVVINPGLVDAFSLIGEVLELAVEQVKEIVTTLSARGAESTFLVISSVLKLAVTLVGDLVQGFLLAARAIGTILEPFVRIAQAIATIVGPTVNRILVWGLAIGIAFKLAYASSVGLYRYLVKSTIQLAQMAGLSAVLSRNLTAASGGAAAGQAVSTWTSLSAIIARIGAFFSSIAGTLTIISAGILSAYYILDDFKDTLQEITGLTVSWGTALQTAAVSFINRLSALRNSISDLFSTALAEMRLGMTSLLAFVSSSISAMLKMIPEGIPVLGAGAQAASKQIDKLTTSLEAARRAAESDLARGGSWLDRLKERFAAADAATIAFAKRQSQQGQGTDSFQALFDRIPALVSTPMRDIDALAEGAAKLRDEITGANEELRTTLATLRATAAVQQQAKLVSEARIRVEKETKVLDADKRQAEADLLKAEKDRLAVEDKLSAMKAEDAAKAREMVALLKDYTRANSDLINAQDNQKAVGEGFAKGKTSLLDVSKADAAVKTAQAVKDEVYARGQALKASMSSYDISLDLLDVERRQADASKRISESDRVRANKARELFQLYETKVATIAAAEFEAGKQRILSLQQQYEATRRLLGAEGDGGLAAADNEVEANKAKLAEIIKTNKAQQEGLEYVIKAFPRLLGLQASLNQLKQEGAAAEALAAAEGDLAVQRRAALVREIGNTRRDAVIASRNEIDDLQVQIDAERTLLRVKQEGSSIDEQIAEANAQMAALTARTRAEGMVASEKEKQLKAELAITTDLGARAHLEGQLTALREKTLKSLILQGLQLARMRIEQERILQAEKDRNREIALNTAGSRATFNAGRGTDREATALIEKFVALERERATLETILNTQRASTEEIEAQQEAVRQVGVEYQELLDRANDPIGEGLLAGAKDFLTEVPTAFETAADFTKTAFEGLASVAADSLTAAFDPRNTTTLRERLGELFLGLGNLLFKSIFENLIGTLISNLIPSLAASGTTAAVALTNAGILWEKVALDLNIAAANLAASGGIAGIGGAVGFGGAIAGAGSGIGAGSVIPIGFARGGPVRYFGSGRYGKTQRDNRDTIPAFLRKGEHVIQPEAVNKYGEHFFQALNSMSLPAAVGRDLGKVGRSTSMPSSVGQRAAVSPQKVEVSGTTRAVLVPDEQTMERLLAGGDGAMQRYLAERGYQPTWRS